jgi:hypothetical protein
MVSVLAVRGQPPAAKPEPPLLVVAAPLHVTPGQTNKLSLRGLRLDGLTELRSQEPRTFGKLLGKLSKVGVPQNAPPQLYGDTQIEVEVKLPAEVAGQLLSLTVVGPKGESNPVRVLVNDDTPRLAEKEPNNGFATAQVISVPQALDGSIQSGQDVDVYRITGLAGQRLRCEVWAARLGSPLDPTLTLYSSAGQILASADDSAGSRDPILTVTLPTAGVYWLSVADALDQGGGTHAYRLSVRVQP